VNLLLLLTAANASGIVWIHDDWDAAKKQALARKQLVAVDVWATWCHPCISMSRFTLEEAPMAAVKDAVTWLALEYEREENAPFFEKYPIGPLPTYMVIDPKNGDVVARWVGSGTAEQMAAFFGSASTAPKDSLAEGQRALARGDHAKARRIFETALTKEKLDRVTKTRIVNGLAEALWSVDRKACAIEVAKHMDALEDSVQGIDAIISAASCAIELEDAAVKAPILEKAATRLESIAANEGLPLSADDRSSVWSALIEIYDAGKDPVKASRAAEARLSLLERAAAAAPTPDQRATFDYHRMDAYVRLGRFDDAEKMLLESEKSQPRDFNHPWRLAVVMLRKGDYDRGLAAIDRALGIAYGGRKLRLYSTKLDLLAAKKDEAGARATVKAARADLAKMKKSQVRDGWRKELEAKAKPFE
jgi:tetratricopeptide (TPR) repeat protein